MFNQYKKKKISFIQNKLYICSSTKGDNFAFRT